MVSERHLGVGSPGLGRAHLGCAFTWLRHSRPESWDSPGNKAFELQLYPGAGLEVTSAQSRATTWLSGL